MGDKNYLPGNYKFVFIKTLSGTFTNSQQQQQIPVILVNP